LPPSADRVPPRNKTSERLSGSVLHDEARIVVLIDVLFADPRTQQKREVDLLRAYDFSIFPTDCDNGHPHGRRRKKARGKWK
jgi:hypothetical protein